MTVGMRNSEHEVSDSPVQAVVWKTDERWRLVQRIVASRGFQRAAQLRAILEHITKATIEDPAVVLREYEIACEVLGRRASFDPANDNIVRQQMSQLRRRLDQYYADEGRREQLRLHIPRGSYAPHFSAVEPLPVDIPTLTIAPKYPAATPSEGQVRRRGLLLPWPVLATLLILLFTLPVLSRLWTRNEARAKSPVAPASNALLDFLSRTEGRVTVVEPDLSLVVVQEALHLDVTPQEYGQADFLKSTVMQVQNTAERSALLEAATRRLTNTEEAGACGDLQDVLGAHGRSAVVRFARDLRSRDLGEGNLILIGSRRSNPWVKLFTPWNNFQFQPGASSGLYQFVNQHSQPGEQPLYVPYEHHLGNIASYVDVAFGPNLTRSGYVLVINGSDGVANVAAARYLSRGKLPQEIVKLLHTPDLSRFEFFLRGSHAENEAEDSFELIAVRSWTN